jgi:hypothetical protein
MKKAIMGIVMMLICILGVSATTYHIGDTLSFETTINPICLGGCTGPVECETIPKDQCTEEIGCLWEDTELTCETDLSDNEGLFLYGGYALKGPDNAIKAQMLPDGQCNNLPYVASTTYTADMVGTYKFCSVMYALEVNYADLTCSSNVLDCPMESCQEISVTEECHKDDADVYSDFTAWLGSW